MSAAYLESVAQLAGGRVVNCIFEGVLIGLSGAIAVRFSKNSKTRFATWFVSLIGIALLLVPAFMPGSGTPSSAVPRVHLILPGWIGLSAFALWALVAGVGLVRVGVGLFHVWLLHRRSDRLYPLPDRPDSEGPPVPTLPDHLLPALHSFRNAELCISDEVRVPTAIGFFRPAIIVPHWAIEELSPEELIAVLLHELGHLRRWDDWTNLTQKILRAILFFHPAVWWIDSRLSLERESACDDLVLETTANARGYAECLVSVAEKSAMRKGMALALAAVSRVRQTTVRLTRILDPHRTSEMAISKPALASVVALSLAGLAVFPRVPALIVFGKTGGSTQITKAQHYSPAVRPIAYTEARQPQFIAAVLHDTEQKSARLGMQRSPAAGGQTAKPTLIRAKRVTGAAPKLVRTSTNVDQPMTPAMLLVIQTGTFDDDGGTISTIQVWRLTVIRPQQPTKYQIGTRWKSI